MGSFYGNYSIGGGGSGGTNNYNELTNKPITNLIGTDNKPIILGDLYTGEYLIKGPYIYTSSDGNVKQTSLLHVIVSVDEETRKSVCKFEKYENDTWFMYIVIINENEYAINKYSFSKPSSNILFVAEDELPQPGVEQVLYITEKAIKQWKNNKYILMASTGDISSLLWGNF